MAQDSSDAFGTRSRFMFAMRQRISQTSLCCLCAGAIACCGFFQQKGIVYGVPIRSGMDCSEESVGNGASSCSGMDSELLSFIKLLGEKCILDEECRLDKRTVAERLIVEEQLQKGLRYKERLSEAEWGMMLTADKAGNTGNGNAVLSKNEFDDFCGKDIPLPIIWKGLAGRIGSIALGDWSSAFKAMHDKKIRRERTDTPNDVILFYELKEFLKSVPTHPTASNHALKKVNNTASRNHGPGTQIRKSQQF